MTHVPVAEDLYAEVERAANASGQSLERYVADSLRSRLEVQEPFALTPEQLAKVRESQADLRAGRGKTLEEIWASLDLRKAAWLRENGY